MGRMRFVQPETVRLKLSGDDWIDVKKRLTAGEQRSIFVAQYGKVKDGWREPNLEMVGKAQVLAFLLDWSLVGPDGKTVNIDADGKKSAALDALDVESYREIDAAITAHVEAMDVERGTEKNVQGGESGS